MNETEVPTIHPIKDKSTHCQCWFELRTILFLLGVCACVFTLQCNYQINKHHLMIQCHETEY